MIGSRSGVFPWPAVIPRLMTALWCLWCMATSRAYVDATPDVLQATEAFLHIDIWMVWAITAGLLALGTLSPPIGPAWVLWTGSILRIMGMSICAGLLLAWSVEFFMTDMDRGWVTGKNYLILAVLALVTGLGVSANRLDAFRPTTPELPEDLEDVMPS